MKRVEHMICSFNDLKKKVIIDITTAEKLGYIDDIEIDTTTSEVLSMIIYGNRGRFGLFPKEPDIIISCSRIKVIGREVILVKLTDSVSK